MARKAKKPGVKQLKSLAVRPRSPAALLRELFAPRPKAVQPPRRTAPRQEILLPDPVIFDFYEAEHFFSNVNQYRAKPEGRASDDEFMYIPKRKRTSAAILSPRDLNSGQRFTIALWP